MEGQDYDLTKLDEYFEELQKDKKKSTFKALEFILELNKNIKIDEILIREGFESYPQKVELQKNDKNRIFNQYKSFFQYMETYLKESNENDLIDKASQDNPSEYNFLLNKNSVSKFIRDEAVHFQNTVEKYLESVGEDDEQGVKTKNMHLLFMDLFRNSYTTVVKDQNPYLEKSQAEIAIQIGIVLSNYAKEVKEIPAEQAQNQFSINQQQILDFLTFWLRQEASNSLFVLYARTKQRLNSESTILMDKANAGKIHPSRMTKDQIMEVKKQQEAKQEMQKSIVAVVQAQLRGTLDCQKNSSALSQLRSKMYQPYEEEKPVKVQLTKQEHLQKQMRQLFKFGCKRRYKLNKNSTFDDLEFQLTNMNLEKFMFFCQFFEIPKIISRDLIIEYFKLYALNLRTIDLSRFEQIITKLVKADERVLDNLLNKSKFQIKTKRNQIRSSKKTQQKPSTYKFKLRPINGKDVSSIQKQLTYRKLQKQIDRQEKDHKALARREKLEKTKTNFRSISNLKGSRLEVSRLESSIQPAFNPQKFIGIEKDNDDLWDAYQAKIWKKQPKSTSNALESILSKRINKGATIIKKINSQRSLLFE